MPSRTEIKSRLFSLEEPDEFNALALDLFHYQAVNNPIYKEYLQALNIRHEEVKSLAEVPFMPIGFFKKHRITSGNPEPEVIFSSSGIGGPVSRHYVADAQLYRDSFMRGFKRFYGEVSSYCILALLPSYLEREGSSLVYMCNELINQSGDEDSGFYLSELESLYQVLQEKLEAGQRVLLIGVSFGLLDFAERYQLLPGDLTVMETGGMKGKRKEMIRNELHEILKKRFGVNTIHSEYGMTELLSQAYSLGEGRFRSPPWMKVFIRDIDDPFSFSDEGKTGGINIADLANIDSCAFVETQDLGRWYGTGEFEVMGRFDNSDIRGCNLMAI